MYDDILPHPLYPHGMSITSFILTTNNDRNATNKTINTLTYSVWFYSLNQKISSIYVIIVKNGTPTKSHCAFCTCKQAQIFRAQHRNPVFHPPQYFHFVQILVFIVNTGRQYTEMY